MFYEANVPKLAGAEQGMRNGMPTTNHPLVVSLEGSPGLRQWIRVAGSKKGLSNECFINLQSQSKPAEPMNGLYTYIYTYICIYL